MMEEIIERHGMGWLPDYPDFRDYTADYDRVSPRLKLLGQKDSVKAMLKKAGIGAAVKAKLSSSVDLRQWCSKVEDQGQLGSCTAQAVQGLEYFEKSPFKSTPMHPDSSSTR
jgi:C1A family cysteine protease